MEQKKSVYTEKKRINELLEAYWNHLRGNRKFPLEKEINIEDLESIWDSCFLVKVNIHDTGQPYTYTYLGDSLIDAYGSDNEREICERLVYPSSMSLVHKFKEVIETGKPVEEDNEFVNAKGVLIKYRSNILPLGDEGGKIGYLIGGMKWKAF